MKQGIKLLRILLENGNLCHGQRLYLKNFVIKQGVYREEDISEILGVGNFIYVCVEANIFFIGEGLASVSHGYVSRYIHDMRAAVFFVLIFRIKIVVVGAVGKWSTRSEAESCPLIHRPYPW